MIGRFDASVRAILLACCLAAILVPAPVAGGDRASVFFFDRDEYDADPGETITVDVVVSEHGGYDGDGVDELSFDVLYDHEVLTVTGVEHRSMLADGDEDAEVVGTESVDDGRVSVEQVRSPTGDGATATAPAATITFEVDEDAEATTTPLEITNAVTVLVSDVPQAAFEREAEVHVDGGDPTGNDAGDEADETEGVTFADDPADGAEQRAGDERGPDDEADDDDLADGTTGPDQSSDTEDDPIPGFAGVATIVAIVALFVHSRLGRR